MLRGKNISRYTVNYGGEYIWYKPELIKEKIGGRPRILSDYLKPKIIIQDIAKTINAAFDSSNYLVNDTINVIHELKEGYSMYFVLCLLNSKAVNFWFKNSFSEGLHIKLNQLQEIPIPEITILEQQPFIEKADVMLIVNKELQAISGKFQRTLQRKFNLENLSNKLEDWYLLSYSDFIKELAKKKIKLSLAEEAEWEEYFITESKKAQALKSQIDVTDKEIDQMVYKLYDLTEEEIAIVEKS